MKNKIYKIIINSPQQSVWDFMIGKDTYPKWIKGFSENSQMIGKWEQGSKVDFIDHEMGGTRATLEVVDEPYRIIAKHIGTINKNRELESGVMENWIGTREEYLLSEDNGITTVKIKMEFHEDFEQMLDEGWGQSLSLLKELCEQNTAV